MKQGHAEQRFRGIGDEPRLIDSPVEGCVERGEHHWGVEIVCQCLTQLGKHLVRIERVVRGTCDSFTPGVQTAMRRLQILVEPFPL